MWTDSARRASAESRYAVEEDRAREKINSIGYDYLGGFTNSDGIAIVRCRKCGEVFKASYQPIRRRGSIVCPVCNEAERAERDELKRLEREAAVIEKMMINYRERISKEKAKAKAEAKKIHACPICGKPTTRRGCCSERCQKTFANRTKDQQRRAKLRDALVDSDIQLMELYRRDGGVCYLCGGACDFSDCVTSTNGAFIAGNLYPSIDHVIPLAAGGKHSWDNVRLAHRICNTIKSDNISPYTERCE